MTVRTRYEFAGLQFDPNQGLQRAIDARCPWRWLAPYDPRLASLCESDVMRELKRPALRAACASVNEEGTRA